MRRGTDWAKERFAAARVARLATVSAEGRPHLVPIVFALLGDAAVDAAGGAVGDAAVDAVGGAAGDTVVTAVDGKPKSSARLKRLANIAANPQVSLLVDEYADDWTQLWWARADGTARVVDPGSAADTDVDVQARALAALVGRYGQYREVAPPGPLVVIEVSRWSGWSAS